MMPKSTGGSAFPHPASQMHNLSPGMTLRDWFAGQALIALMSSASWVSGLDKVVADEKVDFKEGLADLAFRMADAMLAERNKV